MPQSSISCNQVTTEAAEGTITGNGMGVRAVAFRQASRTGGHRYDL